MNILVILPLLLGLQTDPSQDGGTRKQEKRIRQAVEWLLDTDPELRAVGRKVLIEMGSKSIPYLEGRLTKSGVEEIYKVLKVLLGRVTPEENLWVEDLELPDTEELRKKAPPPLRKYIDRYIYSKYYQAFLLARRKNYRRAIKVVDALLLLEPKSRYHDQLQQLRRFCDQRLTQTTIIEAKIGLEKRIALVGDKVKCTLQLRNVRDRAISVGFNPQGRGFAVVSMKIRVPTARGDVHEFTRTQTVYFSNKVELAKDGLWEHEFLLDTGTGLEIAGDIEIYSIHAWMLPRRVSLGTGALVKRVVFQTATLWVVPRRYEKDLKDPLAGLARSMKSGTVNEVFVLAHLLEGKEKSEGIGMLISALRQAKTAAGRNFLCQLLTSLTGVKLGAMPRRWIAWWEKQDFAKEP